MSPATLALLRRMVVKEMRRFRGHEDYEDLVQEGWLTAWRSVEKVGDRFAASTLVRMACRQAFSNWVRSSKARTRWTRTAGVISEVHFLLDLSDWEDRFLAGEEELEAILDHTAAAQVAARALSSMTPPQRAAVERTIMNEESCTIAGRALGINPQSVWRSAQRGLENAREALDAGR